MTSPALCRQKVREESKHLTPTFFGKTFLFREEIASITGGRSNAFAVPSL
jgi:hypothetical protein